MEKIFRLTKEEREQDKHDNEVFEGSALYFFAAPCGIAEEDRRIAEMIDYHRMQKESVSYLCGIIDGASASKKSIKDAKKYESLKLSNPECDVSYKQFLKIAEYM